MKKKIAFAIHGGAGTSIASASEELKQRYIKKITEILEKGYSILSSGGSSMDAVEAAINIMESCSFFNAGKGSVKNIEGEVEMDSAMMDGTAHKAGAVAGVRIVKYPISLARNVLEKTSHVLLIGSGAEAFAKSLGMEIVNKDYFSAEPKHWQLAHTDVHKGTVGAVAIDCNGNIAAGASTGGIRNKLPGRVGDSSIIGAGIYADSKLCGVSCTGTGEYFIRGVVAYNVAALREYKGLTLEQAVKQTLKDRVAEMGGHGGLIAVDNEGNVAMDYNTPGMIRAYVKSDGIFHIDL